MSLIVALRMLKPGTGRLPDGWLRTYPSSPVADQWKYWEWGERSNNTVRERTKIQRGWKADDTPLREGQRLYYNFIREHQGLEGRTPAEMAGLYQASGENRWMELLKKAVANQKRTTKEDTL